MYREDLSPYSLLAEFAPEGRRVKAVGWLQPGAAYLAGSVDPKVVGRLFDMLETECEGLKGRLRGRPAACPLCQKPPHGEGTTVVWRQPGPLGTWKTRRIEVEYDSELFVPGKGCVYAAPKMIIHYILFHGYAPPGEFLEAVLSSPPLDSPDYLNAMRENGGREVLA